MNKSLMQYRKKIVVGCLCLLLFPSGVMAGKIYKWIDKEGNVHFSNTPGPQQSVDAHMGQSVAAPSNRRINASDIFDGHWYGSSRTASLELEFNKDGDQLTWKRKARTGGVGSEYFKAKWKIVNSDLEVTYIDHEQLPEKNGSKELIKVIDRSETSLTLQFPDNGVYKIHKRIKRRSLSLVENNLVGTWVLEKEKQEWEFKAGTFVIEGKPKGQWNMMKVANGTWGIDNGVLNLTHLNDSVSYRAITKPGHVDRYKILLRETQRLVLQKEGGAEQVELQRKVAKSRK